MLKNQRPLFLILLFSLYACHNKKLQPTKYGDLQSNTVVYVVDGDTFDIIDSNKNIIRIRPIGINADEMRNNSHGKKGPFARQAKNYLEKLINHKQVRLEMDVQKKDKYRRILAYVYVDDTTFVNAEMVKWGFAETETDPPNVKYSDYFYQLQEQARVAKIGKWAQ